MVFLSDEKSSIGWLNAISFPYAEIKEGTNNFAEDSILGIGGFGVVYRAVIARSNVAVKLLKKVTTLSFPLIDCTQKIHNVELCT